VLVFLVVSAMMTGHYLTTSGITPDTDRQMIEQLNLILK